MVGGRGGGSLNAEKPILSSYLIDDVMGLVAPVIEEEVGVVGNEVKVGEVNAGGEEVAAGAAPPPPPKSALKLTTGAPLLTGGKDTTNEFGESITGKLGLLIDLVVREVAATDDAVDVVGTDPASSPHVDANSRNDAAGKEEDDEAFAAEVIVVVDDEPVGG